MLKVILGLIRKDIRLHSAETQKHDSLDFFLSESLGQKAYINQEILDSRRYLQECMLLFCTLSEMMQQVAFDHSMKNFSHYI
jgi:hypothetical protein